MVSSVGRFEIDREIGRSMMGVVYLANDPRLLRQVAIKLFSLPAGLSDDQKSEFRQRFQREAQAAARLLHPGIVTVYDTGEDALRQAPYMAMEFVPGQSLRQLLDAEGWLEPERAIAMAGELAEALQAAHHAGIIHRDIKPANILLREDDGAAKIADFGVARLSTSELTKSGASIGSPSYMSPEQIKGGAVDSRSDLFSLAVILYEALSGRRPFTGEDLPAVLYSIVHENPAPISCPSQELPAGLDRFFEKALAKEPGDRFPDGSAFKAALQEAWLEGTAPSLQKSEKRTVPFQWLLLAAPLLLVLALAGWTMFGGDDTAYIHFEARSVIPSADLSLLVDGEEVYSRRLAAPAGPKGRFKRLFGRPNESFEARIEISSGLHEIVAQVVPEGKKQKRSDAIVLNLEPGETRRINLVAGGAIGSALKLTAD